MEFQIAGFDVEPANVASASTILIAIFTLSSLQTIIKTGRLAKKSNRDGDEALYEDADGAANEESMAALSNTIPFIICFVAALMGFALSVANAVVATVKMVENSFGSGVFRLGVWLSSLSWIFLLAQFIATSRERDPVARFNSAVSSLKTCVLLVVMACAAIWGYSHDGGSLFVALSLTVGQIIAVLVLMATICSIERRPTVFRPGGKVVDRQKTVSLWSRYSFHWCSTILAAAAKDKFGSSDLPALDHGVRSENSTAEFKNIALNRGKLPLWLQLVWRFRDQLTFQWIATLISNFFDVAPAFAILQLLRHLETRHYSGDSESGLLPWIYVIGIVVASSGSHIINSRIGWSKNSEIVIPLRSILTGLMYEKLMKVKDSSEPAKEDASNDNALKKDATKPQDKKADGRSQKDIINMFAVDCGSIADFGGQNTEYGNCVGKFIITTVFLWVLIGWQSLCAGIVAILVLFPINKALAQRFSNTQKGLMAIRDRRTTIITEALQGIRQIKFSSIENQWANKIQSVREEELSALWRTRLNNFYMSIASEFSPIVLTAMSLTTYSYINGALLPSVAFTSIGLFLQLGGLLSYVPFLMVAAIKAKVSCDRIDNFLRSPEKDETTFPGESVAFHNASFTFPHNTPAPGEGRFTLRDLTLAFPNNSLSVISGPTGSGKSLLLAAVLGEVEVLSGYIQVPRTPATTAADWIIPSAISLVSQNPWIENDTIKNNILFGLPLDTIRYEKVIQACALTHDLAMFEDGDETEVGAQGIVLSGGQKWRLTLARAFYSRAGIMLIDDVFSALDTHVGKHIYDNVIMGELSEGRTRILVTHHVGLCLPRAKYAVLLSAHGTLEIAGLTEELRHTGTLDQILEAEDAESKDLREDEVLEVPETSGSIASPSTVKTPKKLIEEEKREIGRVKSSVYTGYFHASGGWPFWIFLGIIFLMAESFSVGRTYWVRIWASGYGKNQPEAFPLAVPAAYHYQQSMQVPFSRHPPMSLHSTIVPNNFPIETQHRSLWFYLGVYCLVSTMSVALSISRLFIIYAGSIQASRSIFKDMLHAVLRAPLRWLDTIPTGRILNRFTGDIKDLDTSLASMFYYLAVVIWHILGILGAAAFVSPYLIVFALVLLAICSQVARRYVDAARNVKRLLSTSKSPVISLFSASLSGLSTIRAFSKSTEFETRMFALIDSYAACSWHSELFRNWLMLYIGIISSLFAAAVAAFVLKKDGVDASLAGFALSFSMSFGHAVRWAINMATQLELDMNAVERIFEYRDLKIENEDGEEVRASWPEEGKLEVKDLEVGYAEGLPSILRGLTFTVEKNQRIGVVGRTGAGKSTLSLSIFRFLQTRRGSITIDGIDISKIKLHDLRTRLTIIPQDPVLFSGTIRSNLDPFDEFSDLQIREALMRVHLIPSGTSTPLLESDQVGSPTASSVTAAAERVENVNIFLSLTSPIASSGSNLSQGQKQLLCLARAILTRPKLLLLDEATSAVDMETEILIQRSICEEFANTTLLVVAHRLSTVADFDRILVMKDGATAEFGSPKDLLKRDDGMFKGLVEQSGEKEQLERVILSN